MSFTAFDTTEFTEFEEVVNSVLTSNSEQYKISIPKASLSSRVFKREVDAPNVVHDDLTLEILQHFNKTVHLLQELYAANQDMVAEEFLRQLTVLQEPVLHVRDLLARYRFSFFEYDADPKSVDVATLKQNQANYILLQRILQQFSHNLATAALAAVNNRSSLHFAHALKVYHMDTLQVSLSGPAHLLDAEDIERLGRSMLFTVAIRTPIADLWDEQ